MFIETSATRRFFVHKNAPNFVKNRPKWSLTKKNFCPKKYLAQIREFMTKTSQNVKLLGEFWPIIFKKRKKCAQRQKI
jgi:hypothetical protein